ncbi:MAG: hypothetical protein EP349_05425 [Alphaproteobacteria bacterium]|nr:MAG: hypothetical protein EP349_05425 [Alphaproteobacteria bacterium]
MSKLKEKYFATLENGLKKWESRRSIGKPRFILRASLPFILLIACLFYLVFFYVGDFFTRDEAMLLALGSGLILGPLFGAYTWHCAERQLTVYKETGSIEAVYADIRAGQKEALKLGFRSVGAVLLIGLILLGYAAYKCATRGS